MGNASGENTLVNKIILRAAKGWRLVVQCGVLNIWVCSGKLLLTPKGNEYKHATCLGSIKFYGNRLAPYELVWLDSLLHFFFPCEWCFWSCLFMSPVNSHCLYNSSAPFLFVYPSMYTMGGTLPTVKEGLQRQSSSRVRMPSFSYSEGPGMDFDTLVLLGTTD